MKEDSCKLNELCDLILCYVLGSTDQKEIGLGNAEKCSPPDVSIIYTAMTKEQERAEVITYILIMEE